jgi:hypothetical protein
MDRLGMRHIGLQTWQEMEVEVHALARADWDASA